MPTIVEPAHDTIINADCDVLVAGGGPAGFCAALAAARTGARTTLIEAQGCLGGIWTSGLLAWILDHEGKGGILGELIATLTARGLARPTGCQSRGIACDIEGLKLLLEELACAAGIRLRYHTRVVAATCDGARVAAVITESRAGREAWTARQFIDCTGDGDLAARAGCSFAVGRPEDGRCQPLSLMALLAGVDDAAVAPWVRSNGNPGWSDSQRILDTLSSQGVVPSYGKPILFRIHPGLYGMMANHEYEVRHDDADGVTTATVRARAEYARIIAALRAGDPAWAGLRLVATSAHIGVREGRRILGRYRISTDDLVRGARFPDAVTRCSFGVDVHALSHGGGRDFERTGVRSQPYDLPLRALIAADRDNLLMGGRCISGDFIAHSSYRVTGNAAALGQAAGTCAALAARSGAPAAAVPWEDVATALGRLGWTPPG